MLRLTSQLHPEGKSLQSFASRDAGIGGASCCPQISDREVVLSLLLADAQHTHAGQGFACRCTACTCRSRIQFQALGLVTEQVECGTCRLQQKLASVSEGLTIFSARLYTTFAGSSNTPIAGALSNCLAERWLRSSCQSPSKPRVKQNRFSNGLPRQTDAETAHTLTLRAGELLQARRQVQFSLPGFPGRIAVPFFWSFFRF